MSKPLVAVVGRPNVGKSTFFNKVVGRRVSIVEDTPGVTRDRIYAEAEWKGIHFALIDTGGIEPDSKDIILSQMRHQAEMAMDTSDVILFMVDGKEGITAADREVRSNNIYAPCRIQCIRLKFFRLILYTVQCYRIGFDRTTVHTCSVDLHIQL